MNEEIKEIKNNLQETVELTQDLIKQVCGLTRENAEKDIKVIEMTRMIKKMKCCGNCKHKEIYEDENYCPKNCIRMNYDSPDCWELKE